MGIQINGQTDNISAVDGSLSVDGITDLTVSGNLQTSSINNGPLAGTRNRIINGDMRIDQRNAGAAVTNIAGGGIFAVDRWQAFGSQTSKFSVQRNQGGVTPPSGFTNYLGATSLAATTVGASEFYGIYQVIEGFNTDDLAWGTASAQSVTLSFWIRSSLVGTHSGNIISYGNTVSYVFTYSVAAANTWEYKTIAIPGATVGTWNTNNNGGPQLFFNLGAGSAVSTTAGSWSTSAINWGATGATSVVATNGATFYITGVQLEAGTVATPFERRSYGQELALCQRYYQQYTDPPLRGVFGASTQAQRVGMILPVTLRAAPTCVVGALPLYDGSITGTVSNVAVSYLSPSIVEFDLNSATSFTAGRPAIVYQAGSSTLTISAEL